MDAATPAAGWYADPKGRAVQRYWNGAAWTPYVIDAVGQQLVEDESGGSQPMPNASASGHGIVIQNIVQAPQPSPFHGVVLGGPQKSVGMAVLLTVLFGPLGLLYASVLGGIILTAITVLTMGLGIVVTWPAAIIWAIVAVNNHNQAALAAMQGPQPIHSRPYFQGQNLPRPGTPQNASPPMGLPAWGSEPRPPA